MFAKKIFNWFSHFLRICILLVLTTTHICTQWTPKFFCSFLAYEYSKFAEFYADFKSVGIIKKILPEKVIWQTLLQVISIEEEENLWFFTLILAVAFLLANFSHFSQQFRNQRKILRCFDTHIQILQRKSFYVILALFWNLKPDSQETAQNFKKRVLQKCLRLTFYTYKPVNPFHFLKKHQNRCTLMYAVTHSELTG